MPAGVHDESYDVAVIGAGPVGLATAIACQQHGLRVVTIDQGCICNALYRYPTNMVFFSTAERIEIAGVPFPTLNAKPTRAEALHYYRQVALSHRLALRLYTRVTGIAGSAGAFTVATSRGPIACRRVILATGFFDRPVTLGVPGEDLPHVSHYFTDGHPYAAQDLVIVGGANSAVIAALECWRHGARVHLVHREAEFYRGVKYWLRPDIENRIADGEITVSWQSELSAIEPGSVSLRSAAGESTLPADFVLLLTGYRSDFSWLESLGVTLNDEHQPEVDPQTFACQRAGIHLVGCVLCGERTGDIFIENGRDHADQVAKHLAAELIR